MKILLTGTTGYIGNRLLPVLLEQEAEIVCRVRDKKRFPSGGIYKHPNIILLEVDFLQETIPSEEISGIDAAYYLIDAIGGNSNDCGSKSEKQAENFVTMIRQTTARQIIYLGSLTSKEIPYSSCPKKKHKKDFGRTQYPLYLS